MPDNERPDMPTMESQEQLKSSPCPGTGNRRDMNQNLLPDTQKGSGGVVKLRRAATTTGGNIQTMAESSTGAAVSKDSRSSDVSVSPPASAVLNTAADNMNNSVGQQPILKAPSHPNHHRSETVRDVTHKVPVQQPPKLAVASRCYGLSFRVSPTATVQTCYGLYHVTYQIYNPTIAVIAQYLKKDTIQKLRIPGPYRGLCYKQVSVNMTFRHASGVKKEKISGSTVTYQFSSEHDERILLPAKGRRPGQQVSVQSPPPSKIPASSNTLNYALSHPWQAMRSSVTFVSTQADSFWKEWTRRHAALHLSEKTSGWVERTWKKWSKNRKSKDEKRD